MAVNSKLSFGDQAAVLSAAATLGITQRAINTWNPYLVRTPRVLVPIQVDALVVRPQDAVQKWADCGLKPHPGSGVTTRRDLLPTPFAELSNARTAGVYLHWALPDALTAGSGDETSATFPAAPDRWLVLRMSPSPNRQLRRAVRGWVLRAGDQNPVPVDLDSFSEGALSPDAVKNPLTVLGSGDVSWSAYYDNVANRLAFYDSLTDVKVGPLAYLVCG